MRKTRMRVSTRKAVLPQEPVAWEYMDTTAGLDKRNDYGRDGWKLVAATQRDYGVVMFHFARVILQNQVKTATADGTKLGSVSERLARGDYVPPSIK